MSHHSQSSEERKSFDIERLTQLLQALAQVSSGSRYLIDEGTLFIRAVPVLWQLSVERGVVCFRVGHEVRYLRTSEEVRSTLEYLYREAPASYLKHMIRRVRKYLTAQVRSHEVTELEWYERGSTSTSES